MDRERLLDLECKWIQAYMNTFPDSPSGLQRIAYWEEFGSGTGTNSLLIVQRFPLPDNFRPVDEMDLLLNVSRVPEVPPIGIYVMESPAMTPVITRLKSKLNVFGDGKAFHNAVPPVAGYSWVCHVYDNNVWVRDHRAPHKGDCLYKFLQSFFSAAGGA